MNENNDDISRFHYYFWLDDDGYGDSLSYQEEPTTDEEEPQELLPHIILDDIDSYDFSGERLHAYRWDSVTETLSFDSIRYTQCMAELQKEHISQQIVELTQILRQTDSVILEALEGLLSATTLTGFLSALIAAAKNVRETLSTRTDIREQIEALRKEIGG